jgi:lipoprotein-releasing system permease protein
MEMAQNPDPHSDHRAVVQAAIRRDLAIGVVLAVIGVLVRLMDVTCSTTGELASYASLLAGSAIMGRGTWKLLFGKVGGWGYKSFVAWRYLLVARRKIRPWAQWLLVGGLGTVGAFALLQATHLVPDAMHDATRVVAGAAVMLVIAVEFGGVLPHSKPALIVALVGVAGTALSLIAAVLVTHGKMSFAHLEPEQAAVITHALGVAAGISSGITALAMFFGTLRGYFTFFTTVPIGGVWIGTAALVTVLSVMGGFESDLREKILGSNAHIQITREDGDFVEWRDVKARIDAMPGVVASTPFAVSEVVVAANNTGMNVIIKGIDPKTVGKVTDLVLDLEDRDAMKRLDPILPDARDRRVPQHPRTGSIVDPPPPGMPTPGEPIDFSGPGSGAGLGSGAGDRARSGGHADGAFGGDAVRVLGEDDPAPPRPPDLRDMRGSPPPAPGGGPTVPPSAPVPTPHHVAMDPSGEGPLPAGGALGDPTPREPASPTDPRPPDLVTSDEPPTDYSRPDFLDDAVKVIDPPFDTPAISRRTQSLPGILVGRELVKQTHLYTGEEVRVVSPLSDPANPDANGTPIPFNRDYRVAGTFFTGMYEYDLKYVYVSLESLQEFLDRGDAVDGIEVRVANPYDTDAFVAKLAATFGPNYRVQDWKELNRSLFSALKLEKIAMFLVLGIVIVVASFSILGNLIMVVVEKAREIALLKTLGASDAGVMQLFAIQGLMIGIIGTVLGVVTGLLLCWGLAKYGFPLNADVYYIDRLPVHVDPWSVVATAAAGIVISILATLYPAAVAARVRPAAGMRH